MIIGKALDVHGVLKKVKTVHECLQEKRHIVNVFHSLMFRPAVSETVETGPSIPHIISVIVISAELLPTTIEHLMKESGP